MNELSLLHDLSRDLAGAEHLGQLAHVLTERGIHLFAADAGCTYVRRSDGRLEMLAERNCTTRFKTEWHFIPAGALSLAADGLGEQIFLGSASEFKLDTPDASELVDNSERQLIGYAPLRAGDRLLGVFGFSYNQLPVSKPTGELARTFASVAGLALMRFFPDRNASDLTLSLVPERR